jgi:hypothetical protein
VCAGDAEHDGVVVVAVTWPGQHDEVVPAAGLGEHGLGSIGQSSLEVLALAAGQRCADVVEGARRLGDVGAQIERTCEDGLADGAWVWWVAVLDEQCLALDGGEYFGGVAVGAWLAVEGR